MTTQDILSHSPDAASTSNAKSLAKAEKWAHLGAFDGEEGEVVWGEIKGSSGEIYRSRVALDAEKFDCSCPSRKRPCKHSLALALLRESDASKFKDSPSDWVLNDEKPAPQYSSAPPRGEIIVSLQLPPSWQPVLGNEVEKPYFRELEVWLRNERENHTIYPPSGQEFAALEATPYENVKVFILGQDPYHGPKQAHGLAFSVQPLVAPPPSLQNIFSELKNDVGASQPRDGYLMPWAKQGVLLLNAVLTVRRGEANSHKNQGWETFTDAVIRAVSAKEERVVFVLWGAYAGKKEKLIDTSKHAILRAVHPSPLSAHNGFFGSKPFSQINTMLREAGRGEVDWELNLRS